MQPYLRINFGADHAGHRLGAAEIAAIIGEHIRSEPSLAGSRLPPVRVLAHRLGVSKNTVHTAYEELKAQGLVESRNRTGLFVAEPEMTPDAVRRERRVALPAFRPPSATAPIASRRRGWINLSSVFIDPGLVPKEKLAACFRSVLKSPGLADFHHPQGHPLLRAKIAERLTKRGMEVRPEHVVITVGSQQALDIVSRSLEGGPIATEDPAYHLGKALFAMNGVPAVGLPVDPFGAIDLTAWEKILAEHRPRLAYLTPSFQNPTGYSYSTKEISRIIEWSEEYGFGILEDDWGSDMLSYSEFKPSLRALGGDNVLYMNSFTKKLLPSLRIGYVVGNERTVESLVVGKRVSVGGGPTLIEAAVFEFLDRGYYDVHLRRLQTELDARYRHCLDLLRALMPPEVRWTSPGGGPVLWLECPRCVSLTELATSLEEKRISLQLSKEAFFGPPHLHGFKIGYAFLSKASMEEALEALSGRLRAMIEGRSRTTRNTAEAEAARAAV